jgi:RNA polymerase sigma factor (TIGR02999 family)
VEQRHQHRGRAILNDSVYAFRQDGRVERQNNQLTLATARPIGYTLLIGTLPVRLSPVSDVTRILSAIDQGDPHAADQLLPLVYDELRKLAAARLHQEKPGQTLQATALVHEVYLRLVGNDANQNWHNRGHFFAAAAEAMRRILLNRARDKKRLKRGGSRQRINLDLVELAVETDDDDLIAIDEALEKLDREDKLAAGLVKLRFFAGLTLKQAALSLGIAQRTAERQWAYARAWLFNELGRDRDSPGS